MDCVGSLPVWFGGHWMGLAPYLPPHLGVEVKQVPYLPDLGMGGGGVRQGSYLPFAGEYLSSSHRPPPCQHATLNRRADTSENIPFLVLRTWWVKMSKSYLGHIAVHSLFVYFECFCHLCVCRWCAFKAKDFQETRFFFTFTNGANLQTAFQVWSLCWGCTK